MTPENLISLTADDKLCLIAEAEFFRTGINDGLSDVSPVRLKATLVVIAAHDGPISLAGIGVRTGQCFTSVSKQVQALKREGVVVSKPTQYARLVRYQVSWRRLSEMATTEPAYRVGGNKPGRSSEKLRAQRARDAERKRRKRQLHATVRIMARMGVLA